MMRLRWQRLGGAIASILSGGFGPDVPAATAATASPVMTASGPCTSGTLAKTSHYRFAVSLPVMQTMYTAAQVKSKHPTSGEVMLGGAVSMMHTMAMGSGRHLEVQICSRATGKVVIGASPAIQLTDAKSMTTNVPVVEMEGIGMGSADYHYGNDVAVTVGSRIKVTVKLHSEHAVVQLLVPKATSSQMG